MIRACAAPRDAHQGSWLLPEMIDSYASCIPRGHAHSVEVWLDDGLVGGLYGIGIGQVFFGESMFSRQTDASKVAMARLVEIGLSEAVASHRLPDPYRSPGQPGCARDQARDVSSSTLDRPSPGRGRTRAAAGPAASDTLRWAE